MIFRPSNRNRLFILTAVLALTGCVRDVTEQGTLPYGLTDRTLWTTSRVIGSPEPPPRYRLRRVFPQHTFENPIFIAQDPNSERLLIAEYGGRIYSFLPNDADAEKDLFLDWNRRVSAFSFHPSYRENGQVFVFSPTDPKLENQKDEAGNPIKQLSRVSRFELEPRSDPPRLRPESEQIIIQWPAGGHNGGEAIIGPDGYLYIATGDGTSTSDREHTGQDIDDLLAVMMRLDVERPDPGRAYSIPPDNPFVGVPGAREEIWAYGFRNPWRFSFDPVTGQPWVGDVGQDLWELIELVSRGSNHGWPVMEGSHPFHPKTKPGPTPIVSPVMEHHHREARSITGGYVYQGDKFPELKGAYLYGDYSYGKMWGLRYDHDRKEVVWHQELADSSVNIVSLGVGRDGSFYALDYDTGEVFELARRPEPEARPPFPRKLSETGLFASVKDHRPSPGVIPYTVNVPFWSDGAAKERFLALPGETRIKFNKQGTWEFEEGAVMVKSFTLETEEGNPETRRYIETRLLVNEDDRWVGYTYAWNDEQTDAVLVEGEGRDQTYQIQDQRLPGGQRSQVWRYPSREECMYCHSRAAGFVLGMNTRQMNRDQDYGGTKDNQLRTLNHIGIFQKPLEKTPAEYPALPDPFGTDADVESRTRAYLQVNCAMCHAPSGGGNSRFNLVYTAEPDKVRLIDESPIHDTMGVANARLVAPGDPERSVLYRRLMVRGLNQMPPTSTNRIDQRGAELVADWIRHLGTESKLAAKAPGATF
ncbi:MAG: PQQ-dependent sugar dehydrogenase [Candidatus Aminicenantes bacterium]|nr:PQQ-dependent sugar dehydrogenase [Candidatus Aminicenantes bacterium]